MKYIRIIFFPVFMFYASVLFGQNTVQANELTLPSLRAIIDSALKHSPLLKASDAELKTLELDLKIEQKKWSDYIFIEGGGSYGKFDQLVFTEHTESQSIQSGMLNQSTHFRYSVGVGVKLPVSVLLNTKNNVKKANFTKLEFQERQNQVRQDIEEVIISEYYTLQYLNESLKTFTDIYNTLEISYIKAKKDVENGTMELDSFARLVTTLGKAKDTYLKRKHDLHAQYSKLQTIAGISF